MASQTRNQSLLSISIAADISIDYHDENIETGSPTGSFDNPFSLPPFPSNPPPPGLVVVSASAMHVVTLLAAALCLAAAGVASPVPQSHDRDGRFLPLILPGATKVDIDSQLLVVDPTGLIGGLLGGSNWCPEGKSCVLSLGGLPGKGH